MNFLRQIYLFFAVSCCITVSCTKKGPASDSTSAGPGIYIAGDNGISPVLWKNGSATILSSSGGSASQVFLSGSDVYVAGISGQPLHPAVTPAGPAGQYCYWKNGSQTNIGSVEFIRVPSSIAVAGNNVYYSNGVFWKNGSIAALQDEGDLGVIQSTFSIGNDIYAAGNDNDDNAAYWKNGVLNVLAPRNAQTAPFAFSLYVSGDDVYVGGIDINDGPCYWKNGVITVLKTTDSGDYVSQARSIFVSGSDVYVVGNYYGATTGGYLFPAYWKNGVEYDLPMNGAAYGMANAIFVSGSDVYVVGQTTSGAVYWKNSVETILSSTGSANSIYVQ